MSDQTKIHEPSAEVSEPSLAFAVVAFAILPMAGLLTWMLLQVTFEQPVALWMFTLIVAGILFTEDRVASLARNLMPPASLAGLLTSSRRVRLAHSLTYAPLFAFCFVHGDPALVTAAGEWAGGFALVFALMFGASEASAFAVTIRKARRTG